MKVILLIVITPIILAACAANQNYVHNQYQQAANAEEAAWVRAGVQSKEKCGSYGDDNPLPRKDSVKVTNCWVDISRSIVGPVAVFPDVFNDFMIKRKRLAIDYKKGVIDRDEANLRTEEIIADYNSKRNALYRQDMGQAYQADSRAAQQTQQALQNYNEQLQRQQAINSANMPKTTNCSAMGNSLNCTTW